MAMCGCMFLFNIAMSSTLSTKGAELTHLTQQTNKIERENMNLSFLISQEISMATIEKRALSMGFEKIAKPIALTDLSGVAMAVGR
jgi:hypothetical protein